MTTPTNSPTSPRAGRTCALGLGLGWGLGVAAKAMALGIRPFAAWPSFSAGSGATHAVQPEHA